MLSGIGKDITSFFLRPVYLLRSYQRSDLRPDLIAGLTVAIVMLPQAIAYALLAELPPQVGLYSAIVAAIVGALWGCSHHLQNGPTNTISLLVLSILLPVAKVGSAEFLVAAGVMAVMAGIFQIVLGLARLGVLVNFVSDSVVVGFTAGAGVLIGVNQLRNLLRLDIPGGQSLVTTLSGYFTHIADTHWISLIIGVGVILLIALLRAFKPKWPGPLFGMVAAASLVGILGLDQQGIMVIGELPRSLPPLARLPLDFELITQLTSGALAVGAIGLVEATAIARSIASQSRQRLDSNQEFVGLGLANIATGFFSGYPNSGSYVRSGVNFTAGARTSAAGFFSGLFVLAGMLLLAPLAAFVPRTALAGVLLVTAYGMVDRKEIGRILRGTRGDAIIMVTTFLATLFLPLQFAVISGILLSFAVYIMRTSVPQVVPVLPAENFRHFTHQPDKAACPQLAIFDILGDLYFGAASHVEETLRSHLARNPTQRFLLLRMISVVQCDISGIHALESIVRLLRERGGDVYMMRTQKTVMDLMASTGFEEALGSDHYLSYDDAIRHLYHRVLDPVICIYECEARVFRECQNLPRPGKHPVEADIHTDIPPGDIASIGAKALWDALHGETPPQVIDVRERREFRRGHIPGAELVPLFELFSNPAVVPRDHLVVFVCRGGRRSTRATAQFARQGYTNTKVLEGGMLAWEAAGLLEAIDEHT